MTTDASVAATDSAADGAPRAWQRWLLWLGAPLCLAGLVTSGIAAQWRGGRFAELIVLALVALAVAAVLRRVLRWSLATGLALAWLLAIGLLEGVLPALATSLFALAALAFGSAVAGTGPMALRLGCGLVLMAGLLGWLLPVPLHYRWVYLAACAIAVAWRWSHVVAMARVATSEWTRAIAPAPHAAAFAVLVLGLASTGAWVPTMQADDLAYHLRLPWQLASQHHYPLLPALHVWSMAPWAADVLQAVPHVIAGTEARGSLNALWIALTAAAVWHTAMALGGPVRSAWLAVALYASLPLTAALAGGMQTELPTTALLTWLVWAVLGRDDGNAQRVWIVAILVGGLIALKLASAALVLLLLPWVWWRLRSALSLPRAGAAVLAALAIGGSSYLYAGLIAGNPFLPLFNAWFRSPHYATADFGDARWHAGLDALLPWNLTFHTDRYLEAFAGGAGFVLVAFAGVWALAFLWRSTRVLAVFATAAFVALMLPMQYLRYAYPVIVLMLPVVSVTAARVHARSAAWLLAGVCVLNLAFQANSFWLLRVGMVKMAVLEAGRDTRLFDAHTPERNLIAAIRQTAHGNVLALDPARPYVAELGVRGRSVSHYDRQLYAAAQVAGTSADGSGWAALLRREAITDVLVWPAQLTPAQRSGLARVQAVRMREHGGAEWWRISAQDARAEAAQ